MSRRLCLLFVSLYCLGEFSALTRICKGQEVESSVEQTLADLPDILDEPKTIDPATLMPDKMTTRTTVDLSDSSLGELIDWLREDQGLVILPNNSGLADVGILESEPISERLDDSPIYLLLNRLRSLDLAWYVEDGIIHITSSDDAERRLTTVSYNVGDLLDAEFEEGKLAQVIERSVWPSSWEGEGGAGVMTFLGDVMFIRQTQRIQREIQGLLSALRNHGRQTFVLAPPQHLVMREKLKTEITVNFVDTPLVVAVGQLAEQVEIDVRLDLPALREEGIRGREPITLSLSNHSMSTVLQAITMNLNLSWILRDGVLWITSAEEAESNQMIAVYDVRDLCRDEAESKALRDAVITQTPSDVWVRFGGAGTLVFAKPGILVVRNQERVLMEVLDLLESYRTALRASKPRGRRGKDPQDVVTVYYRIHAHVAESLQPVLPTLVKPESWKIRNPDAPGVVLIVSSPPEFPKVQKPRNGDPRDPFGGLNQEAPETLLVSRAVLIVTQTREVHEEITRILERIENGDPKPVQEEDEVESVNRGGMFGGGMFSVPPAALPTKPH